MFKSKPLLIGHRGAAAHLPENTLPSFRLAFEKFNADMVEFDVHFSKDSVPVVIHDAALERTTNGSGFVAEYNYKELARFDAGFYFDPDAKRVFPERGKGIAIPTLEDVFNSFPGKKLSIEIKENSTDLTRAVMELVDQNKARERVIVGSKHDLVAREMRSRYHNVLRFCSQKEILGIIADYKTGKRNPRHEPRAVASIPPKKLHFRMDLTEFITFLHAKEMKVFYWTINDPAEMKSLATKGADGIISDYPDRFETAPKAA